MVLKLGQFCFPLSFTSQGHLAIAEDILVVTARNTLLASGGQKPEMLQLPTMDGFSPQQRNVQSKISFVLRLRNHVVSKHCMHI
jgi:hypothetical protein